MDDGTGTIAPTGGGGALDGSTLDDGAGNNVNIKNEKDDKNEYDKNNTDSKEDDNNEDGSQLMIPTIPPVNDMDVDIDKNDGSGNNDKCKDSIDTARDSTANTTRNTYLTATLSHLERFGFLPQNVKFIPFSSKANWIYKYPVRSRRLL